MKSVFALSTLLLASTAFANTTDFTSVMDEELAARPQKIFGCAKEGWVASNPTADQTKRAQDYVNEAKKTLEGGRAGINQSKQALKTAWMKHPIVRNEVDKAGSTLISQLIPVKNAYRDAGIDSINLLSGTQRKAFNSAFATCLKRQ